MEFYKILIKEEADKQHGVRNYNFKYINPSDELRVMRINEQYVLPVAHNQISDLRYESLIIPDHIVEKSEKLSNENTTYLTEHINRYYPFYEKAVNFYKGIQNLQYKSPTIDPKQYFKSKGVTESEEKEYQVGEDKLSETQVKLADQIMSDYISKYNNSVNEAQSQYIDSYATQKFSCANYKVIIEEHLKTENDNTQIDKINFYAYPKDLNENSEPQTIVELENATEEEIKNTFIHGSDLIDSIYYLFQNKNSYK